MRKRLQSKMLLSAVFAVFTFLLMFSYTANSQEEKEFSISGKVLSAETGLPVEASICIFSTKNSNDKEFVSIVKTLPDKEGYYTISLPKGLNYKIAAYPWTNTDSPIFYDKSDNLENAKVIYLDGNYDNIDFTFAKKQVYKNELLGYVLNTKNEYVSATVYLRPVNSIYSDQYSSSTAKNNSGMFSFTNIRPGEYILYAVPNVNNLSDGYYLADGIAVNDPKLATVIKIGENDQNNEKYIITLADKKIETTTYYVKGMVYDENKSPISEVEISIYDEKGVPDAIKLSTDNNGVFSFKITGSGKYYIKAIKEGYSEGGSPLYLDTKNSDLSVYIQLIKIDKIVYDNAVKGIVVNTKGEAVYAKIMVMRILNDYNTNEMVGMANSEKTGEFTFKNLKPGKYFLYASPAVSGLASGYYKENDVAVNGMKEATVIVVEEKGINQENYVITLPEVVETPQTFELYGIVTDDNNAPLTDVNFTAYDENGNLVAIKEDPKADKSGYFHLYFGGMGKFEIHANKEGYNESIQTLTFDKNYPVQKIMIVMTLINGQVGGGDDTKEATTNVNDNNPDNILLYPNPATTNLIVKLNDFTGNINLNIYDINGNIVLTNSFNVPSSNLIVSMDISSLQTGTYILRGMNGNLEVFTKIYIKQ
jgi:hypothetical protein